MNPQKPQTQYVNGGLATMNDLLASDGYLSLADRVFLWLTRTMHDKLAPNGGALTAQDLRQILITTDPNSDTNSAIMRTALARLVKGGYVISFGEPKKPYYIRNPDSIPDMDKEQRNRVFATIARTSGSSKIIVDHNSRKAASDYSLYKSITWRLPVAFVDHMHVTGGFKNDASWWIKGLLSHVTDLMATREGQLITARMGGAKGIYLVVVYAAAKITVEQDAKDKKRSWGAYMNKTLSSITEKSSALRDYLMTCDVDELIEEVKSTEKASEVLAGITNASNPPETISEEPEECYQVDGTFSIAELL